MHMYYFKNKHVNDNYKNTALIEYYQDKIAGT